MSLIFRHNKCIYFFIYIGDKYKRYLYWWQIYLFIYLWRLVTSMITNIKIIYILVTNLFIYLSIYVSFYLSKHFFSLLLSTRGVRLCMYVVCMCVCMCVCVCFVCVSVCTFWYWWQGSQMPCFSGFVSKHVFLRQWYIYNKTRFVIVFYLPLDLCNIMYSVYVYWKCQ